MNVFVIEPISNNEFSFTGTLCDFDILPKLKMRVPSGSTKPTTIAALDLLTIRLRMILLTWSGISLLSIAEEFVVLTVDAEEEYAKAFVENVKIQIVENEPENKIRARHAGKKASTQCPCFRTLKRVSVKVHRLKYDNIESFKDIYPTNRFLLTGTLSGALSVSYSAIVWKGLDTWTGFIIRTQV